MKKIMLSGLILSLTILLAACGNAEDKAQGKWTDGDGSIIEIKNDNFELHTMGIEVVDGKIEDVEKDEFNVSVEGEDSKGKVKVIDDELELDGIRFKKEKE